ncbi:5092_t:CDS:1 [Paraglomus brasilianum]|uniref:5092_t:CDS:1 n=1 Tax=Paraglomus brasilianum TaxID=144538 RepID=A0A9N8VSD0_9GLOM|nr:5092_t:CDS:1 [Paraglomus brasilianum]
MKQQNVFTTFFLLFVLLTPLYARPAIRKVGDVAEAMFVNTDLRKVNGMVTFTEIVGKTVLMGKWNTGFCDDNWNNYKVQIIWKLDFLGFTYDMVLHDMTSHLKKASIIACGTEKWKYEVSGQFLSLWKRKTIVIKHLGLKTGEATIKEPVNDLTNKFYLVNSI